MPQPKNPLLRTVVPILALAAGLGITYAIFKGPKPNKPAASPPPATAPAATTPEQPKTEAVKPGEQPAAQPPPIVPADAAATPKANDVRLSARILTPDDAGLMAAVLGGVDRGGPWKLRVEVSPIGVGIRHLQLAERFTTIRQESHVDAQWQHPPDPPKGASALVPFAALALEVTMPGGQPQIVALAGDGGAPVWKQRPGGGDSSRSFEATVVDQSRSEERRVGKECRSRWAPHN